MNTSAWGSAAEWLGAIGTLGAVLIALFLWRQDVLSKKRAQADLVKFRIEDLTDEEWSELVVSNNSDDLIEDLRMTYVPLKGWRRAFKKYYGRDYDATQMQVFPDSDVVYFMEADSTRIRSGRSVRLQIPVYGHYQFFSIIASFNDAYGRRWHLRSTGYGFKFVHRHRAERDYRTTAHGRHFSQHDRFPPGFSK